MHQRRMLLLESFDIGGSQRPVVRARDCLHQQLPAETDAAVNPAGRCLEPEISQNLLPCDRVRIHRIDQCAVEIENEGFHHVTIQPARRPTGGTADLKLGLKFSGASHDSAMLAYSRRE